MLIRGLVWVWTPVDATTIVNDPIRATKSSGNVFLDIGFEPAEAAELLAKAKLSLEVKRAIRARGLTQKQAAVLCGTDQPTLSKVLSGRMTSITIDLLARWLNALGRSVEIKVGRARGATATVVVNP